MSDHDIQSYLERRKTDVLRLENAKLDDVEEFNLGKITLNERRLREEQHNNELLVARNDIQRLEAILAGSVPIAWRTYLQNVKSHPDYIRWADDSISKPIDDGENFKYIHETLLPITVHEYDLQTGGRARKGRKGSLVEIGLNPAQKNLLILGDPGTGKTTGLEKIMYEQSTRTFKELDERDAELPRIPIYVSLREYSGSLKNLILVTLQRNSVDIKDVHDLDAHLASRSQSFLIMLDGLNEVGPSANGLDNLPDLAAHEIRQITTSDLHQHHRFIVTCRIRDYKPPLTKISWDGYGIEELTPKDIIGYLDARLEPKNSGASIYYALEPRLRDLLKNPQLLYMFSEIRQTGFEGQIKTRGQLYDYFISQRLLLDEDKSPSKYSRRDKKLVFAVTGFWHLYETGGPGVFSDSRILAWLQKNLDEKELDVAVAAKPKWRQEIFGELRSNVLLKMSSKGPIERTFEFYHHSYEEFAAAYYLFLLFEGEKALRNPPDISLSHLENLAQQDRWSEPLVLLSGILVDPSNFVRALLTSNALLAGRCLVEGQEPADDLVVHEVMKVLFSQFDESNDTSTAELLYNLKNMSPVAYTEVLTSLYSTVHQRSRLDALVHKSAGRKLQQTGKWEAARALYQEAKAIIEKSNETGELDCALALAISDNADLDDVEGKNYFETQLAHERAIALVENATNNCESIEIAEIYRRYGYNLRYQSDWTRSLDAFMKTMSLAASTDSFRSKLVRGEALLGIGKTYLEQDIFDEASSYFHRAEEIFRELDDDFNLAQALQKMGEAYMGLAIGASNKDPHRKSYLQHAENYMKDSLSRKRNRGDLFGIGITLDRLGMLSEIQEQYEQAKSYHRESMESKLVLKGDKRGFIRSLCGLSRAFAASGEFEEATQSLLNAKDYLAPLMDWEMYGEYHESKGFVILRAIEHGIVTPNFNYMALEHLEQARQIWQQTGRPCRQARVNELFDQARTIFIQKRSLFCEKCGTKLDFTQSWLSEGYYDSCKRALSTKNRLHFVCSHCGNVKFENPKLGVALIIENQDGIVMAKRKANPHIGKWTLIAGYCEYDESPLQTGIREAFEEAKVNLQIEPTPMGVYTFRDDPRADMVHIVYIGRIVGGTLEAGDDVSEVKVFSLEEILTESQIAFEGNRQPIIDWIKRKEAGFTDLKRKIWSFFMLYDDTPPMLTDLGQSFGVH